MQSKFVVPVPPFMKNAPAGSCVKGRTVQHISGYAGVDPIVSGATTQIHFAAGKL